MKSKTEKIGEAVIGNELFKRKQEYFMLESGKVLVMEHDTTKTHSERQFVIDAEDIEYYAKKITAYVDGQSYFGHAVINGVYLNVGRNCV